MSLIYSEKKINETWNQYLLKIYREGKQVNFNIFIDSYFSVAGKLEEYHEGINKEKEEASEKSNESKKNRKEEPDTAKVTFAKKPERLKNKVEKGYLF